MSVEQFSKLKEIDSLTKMKSSFIRQKSEQEDRVSKLNNRRQDSILQTAKLRQDLISTNNELVDLEKKMATLTQQKQRLMDIGGDEKKILQYSEEISSLEEAGLTLLSSIEGIEKEMEELKSFQEGIGKTISEIENEVRDDIEKINTEVTNIDMRINFLMEELPPDFRSTLQKTSAKKLAHGPFTRIEQGSCYFCRFKISRIDESEIDMQKNLKTCPQCSRIFLPYGA